VSGVGAESGIVPYKTVTDKNASTDVHKSTTSTVATPEILGAQAQVARATDAEKAAREAKTGVDIQIEQANADAATREAEIRAQRMRDSEAIQKANAAETARLIAEQKAARADLAATKPGTYLDDMSMPRRFLTALSLAGGTYASAWGVQNGAMEIYHSNEKAYRENQEAKLAARAQRLASATGDIKAAQDMLVAGQANILNREILQLADLKAKTEAQIKRVPQAALNGQAAIAQIDKATAEKELQQANLFAQKVEGGSTTRGVEHSETNVVGTKPGGSTAGPPKEAGQVLNAAGQARLVARAKELPELSADDVHQMGEDIIAADRLDKSSAESGVRQGFNRAGKALLPSVFPESGYANVDPKKAEKWQILRELNRSQVASEFGARLAGNPDALRSTEEGRLPNSTDSPENARRKENEIYQRSADANSLLTESKKAAQVASVQPGAAPNPLQPPPASAPAPAAPAARKAPRFTSEQSKDYEKFSKLYRDNQKTNPARASRASEGMRLLRQAIGGE
jgi:hypothetical protein